MIEIIFSLPRYIMMPVVLIGYSIACLGVGLLFLKLFASQADQMERISAGTMLATGFILGQGVLGSLWVLLALAGWFSIEIVGILCFVFGMVGLYLGRNHFSGLKGQIVSIWRQLREDTWGWQLVAGLTVILCLLWLTSLGRPLRGDGTAFYFALGKAIAFSQRLVPLPGYDLFTNTGLMGELHFAALMALHSPEAAQLFPWPIIVAGGIMLAALGRVAGMDRRGQWLTLSIMFSSSAVFRLIGNGKVDLFAAALGLAAYYWAVQIRFRRTRLVLLLTGLLSGFAMVAKLSYIPVMVPTIALLVLWGYKAELRDKGQRRSALRAFLVGCILVVAGVTLAFVPHFVKNGLLYQNPISPIGSEGANWMDQDWFGPEVTRRIILTYPFALIYGSYWAQGGNLSPLFLAFLPLAFYLLRPRALLASPLVVITLTGLVGVIAWVLYSPSLFAPRYILATLLLLILLPARAAEYVSLTDHKPRLLAAAVLVSVVVSLSAVTSYFLDRSFSPSGTFEYLIGNIPECQRDGEYCEAMQEINHKAQPGERIYLASYQRYWLRGDLLQCVDSINDHFSGSAGEQFWLEMYQGGFTYLFIDKSTHSFILNRFDLNHIPQWLSLDLIYDKPSLTIYRMKFDQPPSPIQPALCQRLPDSTIWEVVYPSLTIQTESSNDESNKE